MTSTGHLMEQQLFTERARLEVRKLFFSQIVVEPWTKLPDEVLKAVSQQVKKLP